MKFTLSSPQPPSGRRTGFFPLEDTTNLFLSTNQMTTSPIRVKGHFNLGAPNTAKLWG